MIFRISSLLILFSLVVSTLAETVDLDIAFYSPEEEAALFENVDGEQVRNVILLIGDGMGLGQIALTRIYAVGASGRLTMERLPIASFVNVHSARELITDSAASGTAYATGVKTANGLVGKAPDGREPVSIMELAHTAGLATGLVVTSSITHATPASFAAHEERRGDEDLIAADMAESGVDVMLGGGRRYFVGEADPESRRSDGRDLLTELSEIGYDTVSTRQGMLEAAGTRLIGLFKSNSLKSTEDEPTLQEMTTKALRVLAKDEEGFFLMVEGSQIDWAGHGNDPNGVVFHTLHFDLAVREAVEFARKDGKTLVLVTADHETGGLTLLKGELDGTGLEVHFSTTKHTAVPVPLFAFGPGSTHFSGMMDNTEVPRKIAHLLGLEGLEDAVSP